MNLKGKFSLITKSISIHIYKRFTDYNHKNKNNLRGS